MICGIISAVIFLNGNNINATCCFTGHRIIQSEDMDAVRRNLSRVISALFDEGFRRFITGGALGFDTEAALAVLKARDNEPEISLTVAVPCREQDKLWSDDRKELYRKILDEADEVVYVSEEYNPGCMHKRNRFMVDGSAAVVAYINRPKGGTAYTVCYAMDEGRRIINIMDI